MIGDNFEIKENNFTEDHPLNSVSNNIDIQIKSNGHRKEDIVKEKFSDIKTKNSNLIGVYFSKDNSDENLVFKTNDQSIQHPLNSTESDPTDIQLIKQNDDDCATIISKGAEEEQVLEDLLQKNTTNKRSKAWYKRLQTGYLSKQSDFKRIFKDIPKSDRLIADYSCALQKNILVQGRLYISQHWVAFYSNIFGVETSMVLPLKNIKQISKNKTAHIFSNAMEIHTSEERYSFSSLNSRDKTMLVLYHVWNLNITEQEISSSETWFLIHHIYGQISDVKEEVGYEYPTEDVDAQLQCKLQAELLYLQSVDSVGLSASEKECLEIPQLTLTKSSGSLDISPSTASPNENNTNTISSNINLLLKSNSDVHSELDIKSIDQDFACSVDQLFKYLFSDSDVFRKFVEMKKTTNVMLSDWETIDNGTGKMMRKISYNLLITVAIKTRPAPTTEKQVMHESSKPGESYLIDCECVSEGVPYSENFYIVSRYYLQYLTPDKSHLNITSKIIYRKNVWSVLKSFIDKNAMAGIIESFNLIASILNYELNKSEIQNVGSPNYEKNNLPVQTFNHIENMSTSLCLSLNRDLNVRILIFIIISLLLSNAYFYSRINCPDKTSSELLYSELQYCEKDAKCFLNNKHKLQSFLYLMKEIKSLNNKLTEKIDYLEKHLN